MDPALRQMKEVREIALDLAGRLAHIRLAIKLKPGLFDRNKFRAVEEFAKEGQRQRGGAAMDQPPPGGPQEVADLLTASMTRVDALCGKLMRTRFGRDALIVAGCNIRSAGEE
jgi:hypothetical protein